MEKTRGRISSSKVNGATNDYRTLAKTSESEVNESSPSRESLDEHPTAIYFYRIAEREKIVNPIIFIIIIFSRNSYL